jgi:hypothetical protein
MMRIIDGRQVVTVADLGVPFSAEISDDVAGYPDGK